uniref:BapA/Bap/LapF family large adhesin n=1 Tax=Acinetobacter gerneri TaxID=202952 RepID=UPI0028A8B2AC
GTGEAGDTIIVTDKDNNTFTAIVDSNGKWSIQPNPLEEGEVGKIEAVDPAGNGSGQAELIGGDQTPPVVTLDPLAPTNDTTPSISGTAEAGSTVTVVIKDGANTVTVTAVANSQGKWSVDSPVLGEGSHDISVTAKDPAGNSSVNPAEGTVVIDTTAPVVTLDPLAPTNDTTPSISGTAEAGSTVTVVIKDGANTVTVTAVANSQGKWSVDSPVLSEGSHDISVTAKDPAGNSSVNPAEGTVVIDTTPPTGLIVGFEDDTGLVGDGITSNGTINVTGVEDDANWSYSTDGGLSWTPGTGGSFELEEGTYQDVQVKQQDAAGNEEIVDFGKVVIDKTAPTGLSAQLADDTGFSNSDGITQNGLVNVTGIEEGATWSYSLDGGQSWIKGEGTSFTVPAGTSNVVIKQTDAAGNTSDLVSLGNITVDTTKPVLTITSPSLTNDVTPTITGTAEANATVTVIIASSSNNTFTATVNADSNGVWTYTSPELTANTTYTVYATQTDAAGNLGSTSSALNIDTLPPSFITAEVSPNGSIINGKVSEGNAVVKIYAADGTTLLGTANTDAQGNFTYPLSPTLKNGEQLKLTATDQAGNTSGQTTITAPVISSEIISAADNNDVLALDITPTESSQTLSKSTSITVLQVGLGAVLGADVLADLAVKPPLTINVAENTQRQVTLKGVTGGVELLSTFDLYVYKYDETSNQWKQQKVYSDWIKAYLLGGSSDATTLLLDEGKYMFILGNSFGINVLSGYTLSTVADTLFDYNVPLGVSGESDGNVITDYDPKNGVDDVPAGSLVTEVKWTDSNGQEQTKTVSATGETEIVGLYGTLYIQASGEYRYVVSSDFKGPLGVKDSFTYTVTSPSNGKVSANLTIELDNGATNVVVGDINNTVVLDITPSTPTSTKIPDLTDFSVLGTALLGPILSASALDNATLMSFSVGDEQTRKLTFGASSFGVDLGTSYDLVIYKKDPITGDYAQYYIVKKWFGSFIVGVADEVTFDFTSGDYKVGLASTTALSVLKGVTLKVTADVTTDYAHPTSVSGQVSGDATADNTDTVVRIGGQDVTSGTATTILGKYGTLTINADGTYTYVVNTSLSPLPYGAVESFSYVVQDSTGKNSVTTLNIKIDSVKAIDDINSDLSTVSNVVDTISKSGSGILSKISSSAFDYNADSHVEAKLSVGVSAGISSRTITYELVDNVTGITKNQVTTTASTSPSFTDVDVSALFNGVPSGSYYIKISVSSGQVWNYSLTGSVTHLSDFTYTPTTVAGNLFTNDVGSSTITGVTFGNLILNKNGDTASITIQGEYGTLTVNKDGSYSYKANANVYGTETFDYSVTSSVGTENHVSLVINVGQNVTATSYGDTYTTNSVGNDTFTMGSGADKLIYSLLNSTDATGGNGHDTWTDFHVGVAGSDVNADVIDVSSLLSGQSVNSLNVKSYLSVDYDAEKHTATISIDRDGAGNTYQSTELLVLTNQNSVVTIDDLLNNGQLKYIV